MEVICDTSFMMVLGSIPLRNIESIESSLGSLHFTIPNKVADELRQLRTPFWSKAIKDGKGGLYP